MKRPLTIDDMFKVKRVSDPVVSPDGKWVVYTVTSAQLEANITTTDLWLVSTEGGSAKQLTNSPEHDRNATWSPDSKWIAFESLRSGESQIWILGLDGEEARQFTTISSEASSPLWSPDGKWIAFISEVYPEFSDKPFQESDELNRKKNEQRSKSNVKTRVISKLLYRHWDTWVNDKRQHIFVQPFPEGTPGDLTPGDRDAVPTSKTFSSSRRDFDFSPDGKEIAYTATPEVNEAWNTNHDIFVVSLADGVRKQVTTNEAADITPKYSRDGKYIAYLAQEVPQFEADRWQIILYDRASGSRKSLTEGFDASCTGHEWSYDSKSIFFVAEFEGNAPVYRLDLSGARPVTIVDQHTNLELSPSESIVVFRQSSLIRPPELFRVQPDGKGLRQISSHNDDLFAQIEVTLPEAVWFEGAGGTRIHAWIVKPPFFDSSRKYPLVYMVHGGPQNSTLDLWHYRWNVSLWAAQGYVLMAPNPRGSTGFGQQFTNEITRDWGGKVFEDLMKGLDYAESLPYIDRGRKAAAGASFGGFMMYWFQGHAGDRFKTLIAHDGSFNAESMYGTTEELWFDEYEHGGPYWENPESYQKSSAHRFVKNWNTPMLVIHGELDYRVPVTEGMQAFTVLQRKGIPSKMLLFPDEGHWIQKPANSKFWHETVFDWLAQYLKN